MSDGKWGFVDTRGRLFIEPQFDWADDFSEGLAKVSTGGVNPKDGGLGRFSEGLATVLVGERLGYIDKSGRVVIAPQFKQAGEFSEGLAQVAVESGKYGYIDKTGKIVIAPRFDVADSFSEGVAVVMVDSKEGYIDTTGRVVIPIQFGSAEAFSHGLAKVWYGVDSTGYDDTKWGYIDRAGNYVWKPTR